MTELTSFDGTESVQAECAEPSGPSEVLALLAGRDPLIPRGAGLTYCAASAAPGVQSISSLRLNRVLRFDGDSGRIDVEPGIRLGELYRYTVPKGWILPTMPGHPSITVGGCIACNVHGKNQHREGNFVNAVDGLTLVHPDHGEIHCSRVHEPEVFHLTVGGFGLTGFITRVTLSLQRLPGQAMRITRLPVANLTQTVEMMERHGESAELLYSWNDLNVRGCGFGRGFVYVGRSEAMPVSEQVVFHPLDARERASRRFNVYTSVTTPALLRGYRWSQQCSPVDTVVTMARAVFPPNGKEFYFRGFGRKGFREYQVLVPRARWSIVAEALPGLIRKHRVVVPLGSLKLFAGSPELLRFNGDGIVLTLDVPNNRKALELFEDLDALTISCGALLNLSKDGRVSAALARRVMPGYDRFKSGLSSFDRRRRFDSALRRRLEL